VYIDLDQFLKELDDHLRRCCPIYYQSFGSDPIKWIDEGHIDMIFCHDYDETCEQCVDAETYWLNLMVGEE
jgi:hypothetical protein